MPENINNIENQIIETIDEEGNKHFFKLVEIVEVKKNEYGLFEYVDTERKTTKSKTPKQKNDDDLIVMKIIRKQNDFFFEIIEDENEFNTVIDYIEKYEDELEFD